jgi:hypothetical protein
MLRHRFLIFSALLVSNTVYAQEVRFSVRGESSAPVFEIANLHNSAITAFLVTVDLTTDGAALSQIYYDVYSDDYPHGRPIRSAGSRQFPLPHIVGAPLPPTLLQAVIFADGSTWGSPAWTNELLKRRRILLDRLQEAVNIMKDISQRKLPRLEALAAINHSRTLVAEATAKESAERQMLHDRVLHMAMRNLEGALRVNGEVPEAHVAGHYLEMTFDTWRVFLESAKPSPADWSPDSSSAMDNIRFYGRKTAHGSVHLASYGSDRANGALLRATLPTCTEAQPADYQVGQATSCGSATWELVANVGGEIIDKGQKAAFGACYGNIYNCSLVYVPPNFVLGEVHLFAVPTAPINTVGFGWEIDDYVDQIYSCSNCSGGETEVQRDYESPTPNYYVSCQ